MSKCPQCRNEIPLTADKCCCCGLSASLAVAFSLPPRCGKCGQPIPLNGCCYCVTTATSSYRVSRVEEHKGSAFNIDLHYLRTLTEKQRNDYGSHVVKSLLASVGSDIADLLVNQPTGREISIQLRPVITSEQGGFYAQVTVALQYHAAGDERVYPTKPRSALEDLMSHFRDKPKHFPLKVEEPTPAPPKKKIPKVKFVKPTKKQSETKNTDTATSPTIQTEGQLPPAESPKL